MSSSRDLTDVSEDAAHNYLQMSSSRDLTDVILVSDSLRVRMKVDDADDDYAADYFDES